MKWYSVLAILLRRKVLMFCVTFVGIGAVASFNIMYLQSFQRKTVSEASFPSICAEKYNIAFLKVHKAGSSTVTNLLQRFAINRHLNVVLSNKQKRTYKYNYLGTGDYFTKNMLIPIPKNESHNILCSHVVYNRSMFREVLPINTFYFAIVREPVRRFVSAASFYGLAKYIFSRNISSGNLFTEVLKTPGSVKNHFYFNSMAFDFGIPEHKYYDEDYIKNYLGQLDKDLHLVLILEYFDESLVLLKRRLCWKMENILYMPKLVQGKKNSINVTLTEEDRRRFIEWQKVDFLIYDSFNESFWKHVRQEGVMFYEEVSHFRNVLSRVSIFCNSLREDNVLVFNQSEWSDRFTITREKCKQIQASELLLLDRLMDTAWAKVQQQ